MVDGTLSLVARFGRPAIFGAFDGLTAVVAVLLTAAGHPELAFKTAFALGAAECVGMTCGEWLSDSRNGFGPSLVIGLATMAGSVLPAVPYLWLAGPAAVVASVAVLALLGVGITAMRAADRGWPRATAETYGVLAAAIVIVLAIQWLMPAGQ